MTFRQRTFRPRVERLENRWCPAVDVFLYGRSMIIRGDANNDLINIQDDGQGNVSATISNTASSDSLSASGVLSVVVYGNNGDDTVNYNLTADLVQRRNIYLYLGNGNDQANLNLNAGLDAGGDLYSVFAGGAGNDSINTDLGAIVRARVNLFEYLQANDDASDIDFNGLIDLSTVNVHVDANHGNDNLDVMLGSIADSRVNVKLYGQTGNDTIDASFAGLLLLNSNITGLSSVNISTWDGYGNDNVTYSAAGVDVGAGSTLALNTSSYQGLDTVDVDWSGELDGRLNVSIVGGWLSDTLSADLRATGGSTGELYASMIGFWQPDTLTLNVYDDFDSLTVLSAYLNGGRFGGNNATYTSNVNAVNV